MGSLAKKPLCELRIENGRTGGWRKFVVQEDLILHNLHRVIQYSFCTKVAQDAVIEKLDYAFSFQGAKLGKLKATPLCVPALGEPFLSGAEPLKYVASGVTYTVSAGQRARGDAKYYVPRCVEGSGEEAELESANRKMLTSRFGRNQTHNKRPKDLPPLLAPRGEPDRSLMKIRLALMLKPVDYDPLAEAMKVAGLRLPTAAGVTAAGGAAENVPANN